jgi:NAD(P)-dependent dehydrogenase (short-subunit alcohol dehydrogenase family)
LDWFETSLNRLANHYVFLIKWALLHRLWVIGITTLVTVGSFSLPVLGLVGGEFIPAADTGKIQVRLETSDGASLAYTEAQAQRVAASLNDLPHLISTQISVGSGSRGSIVLMSSVLAFDPAPTLFATHAYAAAKAGVLHLGTSCATFGESHGVRVNTVCPGVTETAILEKTGGGTRPDWLAPILEAIDLLTPADIARAILNLIEDDSKAGQHVVVSNPLKAEA